ESALLVIRCESVQLGDLLDRLHASRTRPVCIDILNAPAAEPAAQARATSSLACAAGSWVAIIGFEESAATVRWQVQQLIRELSAAGLSGGHALVDTAAEPLWRSLRDFRLMPSRLTFKANLLPHAVAAFCQRADTLHHDIRLHAHAGSGIVIGHV